ncbi:MAG: hypothetical protein JWP66_966 [Naasia sp.]|nr:hypothetical protein [Naasia sp.]
MSDLGCLLRSSGRLVGPVGATRRSPFTGSWTDGLEDLIQDVVAEALLHQSVTAMVGFWRNWK